MRIKKKKVILKINGKSARFNLPKHQISFLKDKFNVNDIEELDDCIIKLLKSKLMVLTDIRQKKKRNIKFGILLPVLFLLVFLVLNHGMKSMILLFYIMSGLKVSLK